MLTRIERRWLSKEGYADADEARRVLLEARMTPEQFAASRPDVPIRVRGYEPLGMPQPLRTKHGLAQLERIVGPERARVAAWAGGRIEELDADAQQAADQGAHETLDGLVQELDRISTTFESIMLALEEGGEEQFEAGTDDWRTLLAWRYAEIRRLEEHGSGPFASVDDAIEGTRRVLVHEGGFKKASELSDEDVLQLMREEYERRARLVEAQREAGRERERLGTPETVRVMHQLSKIRAARIPESIRRKLEPGSAKLIENMTLRPPIRIATYGLDAGLSSGAALASVVRAGYDPFTAYHAVQAAKALPARARAAANPRDDDPEIERIFADMQRRAEHKRQFEQQVWAEFQRTGVVHLAMRAPHPPTWSVSLSRSTYPGIAYQVTRWENGEPFGHTDVETPKGALEELWYWAGAPDWRERLGKWKRGTE